MSLQGVGATACRRAQPTDSFCTTLAVEFVGIGRCFMANAEHVAVRRACCEAVDVDTQYTGVCPQQMRRRTCTTRFCTRSPARFKGLESPVQLEIGKNFHGGQAPADKRCRQEREASIYPFPGLPGTKVESRTGRSATQQGSIRIHHRIRGTRASRGVVEISIELLVATVRVLYS